MSRRRPAKREGSRVKGRRTRIGWLPGDMRVALDVIDPAGHRLVRLERMHDEVDPRGVTWDESTVGASTEILHRDDAHGEWQWLVFGCKTCRDLGGVDVWTELAVDAAVWRLDQMLQANPDTPKVDQIVTVPIASGTM